RGGVGMDVYVDRVVQRERGMEPFEVMTSESQERMLAIVTPESLDQVLEVCGRWEVRAMVVGTVVDGGRLRIFDTEGGEVLADVPASSLHEDAPLYARPMEKPAPVEPVGELSAVDAGAELLDLLVDPSWVYRQYDHQLFLNTVEAPGADAAVLLLKAPGLPPAAREARRGIAISTDGNNRWCAVDPRAGTALLVAESALNVACAGARPAAVVNCLNFGNPEHPEVMWQLSEAIDGMAEACLALGLPVVGGNVSLYNESRGRDIDPTPVVGVVGLIDHLHRRPPGVALVDGGVLLLLGTTVPGLGGSLYALRAHGRRGGPLPTLDLPAHAGLLDLVRGLAVDAVVSGVHDVSEGGLGVALTEMAVRSGVGFTVDGVGAGGAAELFSESPSRVVVCVPPDRVAEVESRAAAAGVPASVLGTAGGDRLVVAGMLDVGLGEATEAWRTAIPRALDAVAASH
ncbi:MAG: AIR synthase-related protein, partial [Acidimicrobiales bacterium]